MSEYIKQLENGAYRIADTRVSLDSVVYAFREGRTPEQIVDSFPFLTLEQVYGAIAFYLANKQTIDEYLCQGEIEFEKLRQEWRVKNAPLYEKLRKARESLKTV
jgi:uncharacterized protein (DUF433 family)